MLLKKMVVKRRTEGTKVSIYHLRNGNPQPPISRGYNHILGRISWNGQKGFVSVVGFYLVGNNLAFPPGLQTRDEASATWPCRTVSVVGRWHNKQPFGPG